MGKKHYVIYTPKEESEKIANLAFTYMPQKENLLVTDLSCGEGNLLLSFDKKYKETQIYGYDIDEMAISFLKKKHTKENFHFFCEDSLYLEESKKFDVILGNPPYLGEKNHKHIFSALRETDFGKKYYEGKMDYFYFFIEKAVELLHEGGILVYLTTNYWLRADGAKKLRAILKQEGDFLYFEDYNTSLFEGALGQHNMIFVWRKGKENSQAKIQNKEKTFFISQEDLYQEGGKIFLWTEKVRKQLERIKEQANYRLGDLLEVKQGIVSGCDKAFVVSEWKQEFQKYLKPFYKNKDIFSYSLQKQENLWILYLDKNSSLSKDLETYLLEYKDILSKRREVLSGKLSWWQLQWPREKEIFQKPKILGRQRCKGNWFAYSEEEIYGSADVYYLLPKKKEIDLFYILGFLNSELFSFWYSYCGKRKGFLFEFYSTPLKEVPIYYPSQKEREIVSNLVKNQVRHYTKEREIKISKFFQKMLGNI